MWETPWYLIFKESHLRGSGTVDLGLTYSKSCGGHAFGTLLLIPCAQQNLIHPKLIRVWG